MTISELVNLVKTTGFHGYETQLGYVVFTVRCINESSEWLVNVVGDILVVRNVRYSKKLNKILYSTNYKASIDKIDPKVFELELGELKRKWDRVNKLKYSNDLRNKIQEDFND
jgi:hypothetical protein